MRDLYVIEGFLIAQWYDEDGNLFHVSEQENLITSAGDLAYATRAIGTGVAVATGMRLGTGVTAAAKTGAGAAVVTRVTGSNLAFDSTFPSVAQTPPAAAIITYKTTYGAGVATSATAISEAVIVNDAIASDVSTAAANTISRSVLSNPAAKAAGDTLILTWTHNFLGA
jgi:hypothetical protein